MKRLCWLILITTLLLSLSGCHHIKLGNVKEISLYHNDEHHYTFTKEKNKDEIKVFINAVQDVKKQRGIIDMPADYYRIMIKTEDDVTYGYSVWANPDSSLILENSTSKYAQISNTLSKKLHQVVTEYNVSSSSSFNFISVGIALPIIILLIILFDSGSIKKVKRR
jgi:hypothetical protein